MQSWEYPKAIIGENLGNLGLGNDFSEATPKSWSLKGNIDKLDFTKSKNFSAKEHH